MFLLILLILFLVVLWPALRAGWRIWRQMRQMQQFMRDPQEFIRRKAEQEARRQSRHRPQSGPDEGSPMPRRHGKKIASDVGEYVDFEELEGPADIQRPKKSTFRPEEQVTDIKWEDLP